MSASVLMVQIADRCQSVEEKSVDIRPSPPPPSPQTKKKFVVCGSGCRINRR